MVSIELHATGVRDEYFSSSLIWAGNCHTCLAHTPVMMTMTRLI